MQSDNRKFQTLQLKALTIYYFTVAFAELEQMVKSIFISQVVSLDDERKSLLYFYLAGIRHTAFIEYSSNTLRTNPISFSINENFTSFSFSQIVKIERQNHIISSFDFTIPSINNRAVEYVFSDCCEKLISTRNKLAHEFSSVSFSSKEIIEVLSDSQITLHSADWFSSIDPELMDDETKVVFSNLIFMKQIVGLLKTRGESNEPETMDISEHQ